jgi:membrane-bound lytic murein transglycosylase D
MRVWWRYHKVAAGETLASIARTYRTTPQAIIKTNDLDADSGLLADTALVIPVTPGKHAVSEDSLSFARAITRYKVRRGDTVHTVADNFGVPEAMVRRWNHLRGNSVMGHRILYVHLPVAPNAHPAERAVGAKPARPRVSSPGMASSKLGAGNIVQPAAQKQVVRHKVIQGETLSSIATVHHTTVQALKRDNNVAALRPGMVLVIRQ